jgi:hypothetical protein
MKLKEEERRLLMESVGALYDTPGVASALVYMGRDTDGIVKVCVTPISGDKDMLEFMLSKVTVPLGNLQVPGEQH